MDNNAAIWHRMQRFIEPRKSKCVFVSVFLNNNVYILFIAKFVVVYLKIGFQ
jgi:hypothetical protein